MVLVTDTPNTPKYLQLTSKTQTSIALTGVIPSICSCYNLLIRRLSLGRLRRLVGPLSGGQWWMLSKFQTHE